MSVTMTSEVEALKTNEFLRRRKLRIQQVREQSKDIAKKIRERASSEKFKHLVDLDSTKGKEYLKQQDKLIKKLELLHANCIANVGASHRNAAEVAQENKQEKVDLSKQRAREAAAELRRKKQEQLDKQKNILDRRLQARETANEISREKSSSYVNKQKSKPSLQSIQETEQAQKPVTECVPEQTSSTDLTKDQDNVQAVKCVMATQWDSDVLPNEWDPNVPTLSLPQDDVPEDLGKNPQQDSDKSKRPNLFAVSDEMPSSLGGSRAASYKPTERTTRESLKLISEFIKNRDLRLRDYDAGVSCKKPNEELQSIKQTIQRTRASRVEGSLANPVHVADIKVVPVPSWNAEVSCNFCTSTVVNQPSICQTPKQTSPKPRKTVTSVTNSQYNNLFRAPQNDICPTPVIRGSSPFKRSKMYPGAFSAKSVQEKPSYSKGDSTEISLGKKSSVTVYNHSTRDVKEVPYEDKKLVTQDEASEEDAYSQAMREASFDRMSKDNDHQKKLTAMRNKIAMTKQTVEKEFNDTMSFLNSLPKNKSKPIRKAYKDDFQQELQRETRQQKLQYAFKKAQKECRHSQKKAPIRQKLRVRSASDDDFDAQDSQYSWMPMPESDGLAIHIIPTKVKENKSGNAVRFSKIDSYHEYRSRHKHTPPTKDTCGATTETNEETSLSTDSETSSVEDLRLQREPKSRNTDQRLSDAERIIVYKILESKDEKKELNKKGAKILSFVSEESQAGQEDEHCANIPERRDEGIEDTKSDPNSNIISKHSNTRGRVEKQETILAFEHMQEGVYRSVSEKGDNIATMQISDTTRDENTSKSNISSVKRQQQSSVDKDSGAVDSSVSKQPSTASTVSFKSAYNSGMPVITNKPTDSLGGGEKQKSPSGFVQILDVLKDDNYEVVIQLRKTDKKETDSEVKKSTDSDSVACQSERTDLNPSSAEKIKTSQPEDQLKASSETDAIRTTDFDTANPESPKDQNRLFVDRSVDVPFQEYFEMATGSHPVSSEAKAANSVSVQTSNDSSEARRAFLRMSSSTSTTYLSPPELVLPQFLKRRRRKVQKESNFYFPFTRRFKTHSNNTEDYQAKSSSPKITTKSNRPSSSRTPSSVAQSAKRIKSPPPTSLQSPRTANIKTPPNTARSGANNGSSYNKKRCNKEIHKCVKHDSGDCYKAYLKKVQKPAPLVPPPSKTRATRSKQKYKECEKGTLNPIIKWYVDKLLAMNKEGLQTIEVLHQECSGVTTPGSSIVDNPRNVRSSERDLGPKISLEHLKFAIAGEILKESKNKAISQTIRDNKMPHSHPGVKGNKGNIVSLRFPRHRSVHKVKSLNISRSLLPKNLLKTSKGSRFTLPKTGEVLPSDKHSNVFSSSVKSFYVSMDRRSKSLSSQKENNSDSKSLTACTSDGSAKSPESSIPDDQEERLKIGSKKTYTKTSEMELNKNTETQPSLNISTQSKNPIDEEIKSIKDAEDKLQNMEKIAHLTEKCTKRLSSLAKVLEEVRKNKLPYGQVTESPADTVPTDVISSKISDTQLTITSYEPVVFEKKERSPGESPTPSESNSSLNKSEETRTLDVPNTETFTPFLKNIAQHINPQNVFSPVKEPPNQLTNAEYNNVRLHGRSKPPPALTRCLKRAPELAIPHELSTVLEIDSPMSKHQGQSVRFDATYEGAAKPKDNEKPAANEIDHVPSVSETSQINPDLLPPRQFEEEEEKVSADQSGTKKPVMDLREFNEIMIQPFISIQEYAKQRSMGTIEEGSITGSINKDDVLNDELSSLHSEGSLPDVIAELLKRNIISEPFKFDTLSNVNSNSVSSDSTLSVLALSKMKKDKSKKENAIESSDSLSLSSNTDLEIAFKKLGLGWASSTLKRTKECMALSSSSNSSSSSLSQYKFRTLKRKDFPTLVSDSMSSIKTSSHGSKKRGSSDDQEKAKQKTSMATSMTVKEFLTDELAKRITFGEKPSGTGEDFVSLYETKLPEDMKKSSRKVFYDERSVDSNPRARTSTPVQIYKSTHYHSSSSSNLSNGLFSQVEDLSSVKGTSNSLRSHSTSEKDDLTIPSFSLRSRKSSKSDGRKSDDTKSDN